MKHKSVAKGKCILNSVQKWLIIYVKPYAKKRNTSREICPQVTASSKNLNDKLKKTALQRIATPFKQN